MTDTIDLGTLPGLLRQVQDLKRVRDARSPRSLAERHFGRAWGRVVAGEDVGDVALSETALAVAAVRLAGIDADVMRAHGLSEPDAVGVLRRAFDDVADSIDLKLRSRLRSSLGTVADGSEPDIVANLVAQPRAGATHPGLPRRVLEPAESHADHCFTTAAFGVLLSPLFGADPAEVFLTGLAHHLFNVSLPDAGFAGDMVVGDDLLERMMASATDQAVDTLPASCQPTVYDAISRTDRAQFDEPAARAFHAADVLDRVMEMAWHERSARFTLADALGPDTDAGQLDICHEGFYQDFQRQVLRSAGLMTDQTNPPTDAVGDSDTRDGASTASGSYERGGHGAVAATSPLAGGPGAEDGRTLDDGAQIAHLERREMGS